MCLGGRFACRQLPGVLCLPSLQSTPLDSSLQVACFTCPSVSSSALLASASWILICCAVHRIHSKLLRLIHYLFLQVCKQHPSLNCNMGVCSLAATVCHHSLCARIAVAAVPLRAREQLGIACARKYSAEELPARPGPHSNRRAVDGAAWGGSPAWGASDARRSSRRPALHRASASTIGRQGAAGFGCAGEEAQLRSSSDRCAAQPTILH